MEESSTLSLAAATMAPFDIRQIATDFALKFEATIIPVTGKTPVSPKNGFIHWWNWYDQPLEELNWDGATGFGIFCGWGYYRCLDFDYTNEPGIQAVISDLLNLLNLPPDYRWLVKTGKGYHLWVRTTDAPFRGDGFEPGDVTRFEPIDRYEGAFGILEWRYKNAYALVPPSRYPEGGFYTFVNGTPNEQPPLLEHKTVSKAINAIGRYCADICGGCYQELPYCTCFDHDDEDW